MLDVKKCSEAEADFEFECGELHFAFGRLELDGAEFVVVILAAVDQVCAARHLATPADFVVLPLVGQLRAESLARFEAQRRPRVLDVD